MSLSAIICTTIKLNELDGKIVVVCQNGKQVLCELMTYHDEWCAYSDAEAFYFGAHQVDSIRRNRFGAYLIILR